MTSTDRAGDPRAEDEPGAAPQARTAGAPGPAVPGAAGSLAAAYTGADAADTEADAADAGAEAADSGADVADGATGPTGPRPRARRPLRTSGIVLVAITVAAAAGVAATGALGGESDGSASTAPTAPPNTTKVERTTLTATETVDGSLGYGDLSTLQAPAAPGTTGTDSGTDSGSGQSAPGGGPAPDDASQGAGIITWLPDDGTTIRRGETVYSVDDRAVPLLYGSTPFYRTLAPGTGGDDVEILEKNLSELGYTGFTVDQEYTTGTAGAVRDWQEDLGRAETGTVAPGDAVVAEGARRVAEVRTVPGAAPSGALLTWSDTERVVTVDLDVQYEDLVEKGTGAGIVLPDGTTAEGEVTAVGTPATPEEEAAASGGSGPAEDEEPTLPVEFTVRDQKKLGSYQAASVDVTLKAGTRENVLVVPVSALVARPGGGYAVEAAGPDGTEYLPVELGMFAAGKVEISGDGIEDGLSVGVPK
ncbi:peptidoglycan-binding domain-containing protein [Streptomyces sp. Ru87]|uniref:peptidoglycan-binding protein n=1 Tax=Streptomyces sp. Ru87 TaxID=2044307 RepID=UPI000BF40CBF|nr:peptidoglycan-binding domain-containing protein [Streptomyces sp. Ru87]PGH51187.1 hypothetical protein CRI70_07975 [Streptomyces sp. Ru87]